MQLKLFNKLYIHDQKGITLLESIIYISILAIVLVIVVNTVILSAQAYGKARVKRDIYTQGGMTLERILREIRLANDIVLAGSVFDSSPGTLALYTVVSSSDPTITTRIFSLASSTAMIQEGTSGIFPLTSGINVTSLIFYNIRNEVSTKAIRVVITLESRSGRFDESETFYGTAVLRRGY